MRLMKATIVILCASLINGCYQTKPQVLPTASLKPWFIEHGWIKSDTTTLYLDEHYQPYKGWYMIDDELYYFDRETGIYDEDGEWSYKRKLNQKDPRWADEVYNGYTVAATGCAEMAIAMIVEGYNDDTDIDTIFQIAADNGWNNWHENEDENYGTTALTQITTLEQLGYNCIPVESEEQLQDLMDKGLVFLGGFGYSEEKPISPLPWATHAVIIYENRIIDPLSYIDGVHYTAKELWERQSWYYADLYEGTSIFAVYPKD